MMLPSQCYDMFDLKTTNLHVNTVVMIFLFYKFHMLLRLLVATRDLGEGELIIQVSGYSCNLCEV